MGCSVLSLLFNLDLSLLEVLFVYSLKKGKNDIFSMAAHLPSLQLVTELSDSTKGGAKGHVLVRGSWAGLLEHPERPFSPNHSLELPGKLVCWDCPTFVFLFLLLCLLDDLTPLVTDNAGPDKRGHVVEWVEKASFARLNKLFEIAAVERHYETLLIARNLLAVVRESQAYIFNILPRKLPKKVAFGEHYVLKDLRFYKEVKKADAEKRRALVDDRERRKKEGTLWKAPGKKHSAASLLGKALAKRRKLVLHNKGKEVKLPTPSKEVVRPPITYEKEGTIKELENLVTPFISSGPGHLAGLNHSGPSMSATGHVALLAEEAASINQPSSPRPDADATEALCTVASPPMATPMEEMGVESQSLPSGSPSPLALVPVKGPASKRSRSVRNLKFGLIGRLQD